MVYLVVRFVGSKVRRMPCNLTFLSQHNLPNLESASFWIHFIDDELVQFLQSRQIFGILGLPVLVNVGPCIHGLQILLHCHIFFLHTDSKYVSQ